MSTANIILNDENDALLTLTGLQLQSAGTAINDASVTATLYDAEGVAITGAENLTLSYVSGSSGNYEVVIPYTISVNDGDRLELVVQATGSGRRGEWRVPVRVRTRGKS